MLVARGHEVRHLSRRVRPEADYPTFQWDVAKGTIDQQALAGVEIVVNLAGAGIADARWTDARKRLIIASRTESTRLLKRAIQEAGSSVKAYVAGSAIGYYGDRSDEVLTEDAAPGDGFLSESVRLWEEAIAEIPAELQIRTPVIRTGIVLSEKGGALPKMLLPLNAFTSTYFGDGQQWYSWVHIDDICRLFISAIEEDSWNGIYNGVAPQPVRNKTLAQALIDATGKSAVLFPAPAFGLKIALGEMSHTVLDSARCSSEKVEAQGFHFAHPEVTAAIRDILERGV
jgi:hypothetical protein